jgi:hypothetical protein
MHSHAQGPSGAGASVYARPVTSPFEDGLRRWLDEQGVEGTRRLVRLDDGEALVSKFEPGFSARLHDLLDLLPGLFDESRVLEAYRSEADASPPGTRRVDAWHRAMHRSLAEAGTRLEVPDVRLAEVRTGIDSVRAVLEAVLWSDPTLDAAYEPREGERQAYVEGLAALADERDIFTRYYGTYQGRAVRNHCPGAAFARRMLAHAWRACTGEPPPAA